MGIDVVVPSMPFAVGLYREELLARNTKKAFVSPFHEIKHEVFDSLCKIIQKGKTFCLKMKICIDLLVLSGVMGVSVNVYSPLQVGVMLVNVDHERMPILDLFVANWAKVDEMRLDVRVANVPSDVAQLVIAQAAGRAKKAVRASVHKVSQEFIDFLCNEERK